MGEVHFPVKDFRIARADVAELAHADAAFVLHGRTEDAAGEGAAGVKVAAACGGVEHGAGRVGDGQVGEGVPGFPFGFKDACFRVTREMRAQDGGELLCAVEDGCSSGRVRYVQRAKCCAEAIGIERRDAKDAMAARGAPGATGEPRGAVQPNGAAAGFSKR